MLPNDLIQTAFSSLGVAETLSMIVAGSGFGAFIIWLSPTIRGGETSIGYVTLIFVIAGVTFFSVRGIALFLAGSDLWPRNVGFSVLWMVYCAAMAFGLVARRRLT